MKNAPRYITETEHEKLSTGYISLNTTNDIFYFGSTGTNDWGRIQFSAWLQKEQGWWIRFYTEGMWQITVSLADKEPNFH
jgi:hypothetical protein